MVREPGEAAQLAEEPAELVVAAGGDGTVAAVMHGIARRGVPLAILPSGTANNIARALGLDRPLESLIDAWDLERARAYDLGFAAGPWGGRHFVEGVGLGLVPLATAAVDAIPSTAELPPNPRMARAVRKYRETLRDMRPARWNLVLDGADASGDYLLVEVLNIRCVGPNLELSAEADPFDGKLSMVTAGEEHRRQLDAYLEALALGEETHLSLPVRPARRVELRAADLHLDDELLQVRTGTTVSLSVDEGAVRVLAG